MTTAQYNISELYFTNSIIKDYLRQGDTLTLQAYTPNIEGIQKALENRTFESKRRNTLVSVLHRQLKELSNISFEEEITRQIDKLQSKDVFTITTGQQLHPFLGPGYVVVKILEAIQLCKIINSNPKSSRKVVPVFWLASEDHDTDEIRKFNLFGEEVTFDFPENIATGKIPTQQLQDGIYKLEQKLGKEANGYTFFQICKKAYKEHGTLSAATRAIVYELFGADGILVIDADEKEFKKQFEYITREEIEEKSTTKIQKQLKAQFDARGWHYQVMPRNNNLFTIDVNTFQRLPILSEKFSPYTNYSPNALLRPLFQEVILPNVAYIGGMAEVNYWLQLFPVFNHYNIQMPVIWGRNSFTIAKKKQIEKLKQLQEAEYLNYEEQQIAQNFLKKNKPSSLIEEAVQLQDKIKIKAKEYSTSEWMKLAESSEQLLVEIKKIERGEKNDILKGSSFQNYDQLIRKMHNLFFNKANFQERKKSFLELELNYNYIELLSNINNNKTLSIGEYYIIGS